MGKLNNLGNATAFIGALGAAGCDDPNQDNTENPSVSSHSQTLTVEQLQTIQAGQARQVPWSVEGDGQVNICQFEGQKYMIFTRDPFGNSGPGLWYVRCDQAINCIENAQVEQIQGLLPGGYTDGSIYINSEGISKLIARVEGFSSPLEFSIRMGANNVLEVFGDYNEIHPELLSGHEMYFTENGHPYLLWDPTNSGVIRDLMSGTEEELNGTLTRDSFSCGLPGIDSDTGLVVVGRIVRDAQGENCEPFYAPNKESNLAPIPPLRDDPQYRDYSLVHFRSSDDVVLFNASPRQAGRQGRRILQYAQLNIPQAPDAGVDAAVAIPDAAVDAEIDAATPDLGQRPDVNVPPNPDAGPPTPDAEPTPDAAPPTPDASPRPDVNVPPTPDAEPAPDEGVERLDGGVPPLADAGMVKPPDVGHATPDAVPTPDATPDGQPPQPRLSPYEVKLIAGNCVKEVLGEVTVGRAKFTEVRVNGDGSQTCTIEIDPDGNKTNAELTISNDKNGRMKVTLLLPDAPNKPVEAEVQSTNTTMHNIEDPNGQHVNILNQGVVTASAASEFAVTEREANAQGQRVFEVASFNKPGEPKVFVLFPDGKRFFIESDGKTYLINVDTQEEPQLLGEIPECEEGDENCGPIPPTSQPPSTPPTAEEGGKDSGCDCSIGGRNLSPTELTALLALLATAPALRRRRR